jgi:hypothetical protein
MSGTGEPGKLLNLGFVTWGSGSELYKGRTLMNDVWFRVVTIIFGSAMSSTGLWAFLRHRDTGRKATTSLMMGLAYIQITTLGLQYIERKSITKDELEDFEKYFYQPYIALGGNGLAKRIMRDVSNLPFRPHVDHAEIFRNREEGYVNNVRVITREGENTTAG